LLRALGSLALAFPDQGMVPGSDSARSIDILSLLLKADHVVQAVLLILVAFSAAAWGIIIYKRRQFRRSQKHTRAFLEVFRRSSRFAEVHGACD